MREGSEMSRETPAVNVDMGVTIMGLNRSVLGAMFVSRSFLADLNEIKGKPIK